MPISSVIVVEQQEVEVIQYELALKSTIVLLHLDQSAVSTSTRRILSARSINYRRAPRVKPIDLDLNEECDAISGNDLFLHRLITKLTIIESCVKYPHLTKKCFPFIVFSLSNHEVTNR
jgi:hypothetical protein